MANVRFEANFTVSDGKNKPRGLKVVTDVDLANPFLAAEVYKRFVEMLPRGARSVLKTALYLEELGCWEADDWAAELHRVDAEDPRRFEELTERVSTKSRLILNPEQT